MPFPESTVPKYNTLMMASIRPPANVSGNAAAIKVYEHENGKPGSILIQNTGATKIYVAINTDASASVYNYILKASTGAADGSGGELLLPENFGWITFISLYAAGAFSAAVTIAEKPNMNQA